MPAVPSNSVPVLSVVVPVYNERDNLGPLLDRLRPVLASLGQPYEIVFVDDGSSDGTADLVQQLSVAEPCLRLVRLSRNFGHQAALFAGLEHARGAAVVTMDGDLQHPPELIPQVVERWRAGHEVVQTIRREPADTSPLKRTGSRWFYRILSALTRLNVTPGAADFRLMDRVAVAAFLACGERRRFNRGLVQWIGFAYAEVPYDAEPRHAGRSKYSLHAMVRLAGDAIFSFSSWPLRLAGLVGVVVSLLAGAYLLFVLFAYLAGKTQPGWSSTLATVLILGGVNLVVLWILGEYVGRLYEEVKQRPIYIVRPPQSTGFPSSTAASAPPAGGSAQPHQD